MTAALVLVGALGTACAAPDPVLEPEPEVERAQVAVVEANAAEPADQAEEEHHEDGDAHAVEEHHEEGDEHATEEHQEDDGHHTDGSEAASAAEAGGEFDAEVHVVFSEFQIASEDLAFAPGQTVRFHLTNDGELEHEFRLSNQHRIDEHIAEGHEDHGDEEGHHGSSGDVVVLLEPGSTIAVDITFPEEVETYTIVACLLPGHYEAGMSIPIDYS